MKRKFLLLTLMCILMGGVSSLFAQEKTITIGTYKNTSQYFPARLRQAAVGNSYNYSSISQQIYTADEIKAANDGSTPTGKISKLAFKSNTTNKEFDKTVKVYMRNIGTTSTITAWDTSDELKNNKVYEGTVNIDENGYLVFNLNPAFVYKEGNNILICVDNDRGSSGTAIAEVKFDITTTTSKQGAYVATGTSTTHYGFDANKWPNFTSSTGKTQKNVIEITFSSGGTTPAPDEPKLNLPFDEATNQVKPELEFTLGNNTTHYQVFIGTTDSTMVAKGWLEKSNQETSFKYKPTDLEYKRATKYYWKVVAKNENDTITTASDTRCFTTKAFTALPAQAQYTEPEDGAICYSYPNLTWEYADEPFEYKVLFGDSIYLRDSEDFTIHEVVKEWTETSISDGNSYQTSNLAAGTYYWQVNVKNPVGTTKGNVRSFTIPEVENISKAEARDGKLTWTFDDYATEYRVLLSKPTDNKNPLEERCNYLIEANYSTGWLSVPKDKQGSYALPTTLEAGVEYCWTVEVRNFADNKIYDNDVYEKDDEGKTVKVFKPEVDIYRFVTSSMTPVDNTSPKNGTKDLNNPELKWSFNGSSATYYQVYLGTNPDELEAQGWMPRESVEVGGVEEYKANGSFQTSKLTANTTYYWRVDVTDAEDPTAEGISVYEGATWSFVSHLPAPEPSANPTQIKPTYAIVYGGTTISWNILNGVTGYNVYLGETKLNSKLLGANQNYYTIAPEDRKLQYNMKDEEGNGGYDIYVEAVYGTTEKISEAVNVTVTGVGYLSVDVVDNTTTTTKYVAGATITLTQIKDEWGNTEDLNVSYTFETDEKGQYLSSKEGNERPLAGTYKISVEKENYTQKLAEDESDEIVITYNETTTTKLTLALNIPDNVTPVTPEDEAEGVTDQTIVWDFAEGTDKYRFYFGKSFAGLEKLCDWTAVGENTRMEFKLSGLEAETTYYWVVDVKNELGARQAFGDAADVAVYSFTTGETLPVFNTAPANGATNLTNPTLTWKYNGNATRYMVSLGESEDALYPYPDGNWKTRGEEETGSLETASLKERTKYYWRVDVLDANDNAYTGDVWSFVSTLPAPEASASPTEIVPSASMTYGETTISWEALEGVTGYNVYLGTEKLNAEILSAETTEYKIAANTLKLTYNMENGYDIYVEAVYELGNSMSEAVNVKVTGSGFLNAKIVKDFNTSLGVDGATIKLTQLEDEFENVYDGNGAVTEFTTDDNGNLNNERVFNGKYAVEVSRDYYETYNGTIEFKQGETTNLNITLVADPANVFEVFTIEKENTFNSIKVYLDNSNWKTTPVGRYTVYLKNGEEVTKVGSKDFVALAAGVEGITTVYFEYTDWADLSNGSYQFGVAKVEDQINWSKAVTRNYDIFDGEDADWNKPENWKDGVVPGEDAKVHILKSKSVIINDTVKVNTVTIEDGGKLTINGSLTADKVVNNAYAESLIINDGAQLRQTGNADLSGIFNMNVVKWANAEEGWQFISSPFANAKVEALTNSGNYDFYIYDGEEELEWINHKQGGFETVFFTSGVGYLASHETLEKVTLSGTLNNAVSHTWEFTYNEGKDLANFHLLGNPFTFNMDMSAATYNNLVEGVAIVNAEGGYTYVGANQDITTIPVGDGFFVKVKETQNATDEISLSYGTSGTRSSREKSANINLVATSKAGKDNVVINFAGQSEGFNKLQNFNDEIATVCVVENGKAYGIYNSESDVNEIEVMFSAKQMGSYSLSFELNGEFESAVLVDRLTGIETDMTTESEYNFIATSEDMKNRFVVRLGDGQATTANSQFVYQSGDELIIDAEGAIEIIDMMGRVVYSSEMNNGRVDVSNFNNAAYVVRALNEGKVQKVVIY